jgi:hypothetical protein
MNVFILLGGFLVVICGIKLITYIQRKQWPLVKGTIESVDLKIDPMTSSELVGVSFKPRLMYKIKYLHHGNSYSIDISNLKILGENPNLRVNPKNPSKAYLDDINLFFTISAIAIGLILIALPIYFGAV